MDFGLTFDDNANATKPLTRPLESIHNLHLLFPVHYLRKTSSTWQKEWCSFGECKSHKSRLFRQDDVHKTKPLNFLAPAALQPQKESYQDLCALWFIWGAKPRYNLFAVPALSNTIYTGRVPVKYFKTRFLVRPHPKSIWDPLWEIYFLIPRIP